MANFNISPIIIKNVLRGSYSKHTMNDKVTHINTKDKTLKIHLVKKLYHGTNTLYDTVDLNLCQPFKDFGVGYYLTTDKAARQASSDAYQKAMTQCRVCANFMGCRNTGVPGCGAFVPRNR